MRVAALWRYPVKSMQGEAVDAADVGRRGLVGDRHWAVVDLSTGLSLTARREPRLLFAHARLVDEGAVEITLPDGALATSDEELCGWLGKPVALRASGREPGRFEIAVDFEREDEAEWIQWDGPAGSFHDSGRHMVTLASRSTFRAWDPRRFRMNVVLDGDGDDELVGTRVRIGSVELDVVNAVDRCVMTTRVQPGGIERDLDVLRTIQAERAGCLGVGALVAVEGRLYVGDDVVPV